MLTNLLCQPNNNKPFKGVYSMYKVLIAVFAVIIVMVQTGCKTASEQVKTKPATEVKQSAPQDEIVPPAETEPMSTETVVEEPPANADRESDLYAVETEEETSFEEEEDVDFPDEESTEEAQTEEPAEEPAEESTSDEEEFDYDTDEESETEDESSESGSYDF